MRLGSHREGWVGFLPRRDTLLELLVPLGELAARLVLRRQNLLLVHVLLGQDTKHLRVRPRVSVSSVSVQWCPLKNAAPPYLVRK